MQSQTEWVLSWLRRGCKLTANQARYRRGIERLAARIKNLRDRMWTIHTKMIKVTNRYGQVCRVAQYRMDKVDLDRRKST